MSTEQEINEELDKTCKKAQKYTKKVLEASEQVSEDVAASKELADKYEINPLTGEYNLKKFGAWNILKNKGKPKA